VAPIAGRLSVRVPVRLLLGVGMLLVAGGLLAMTAITPTSGWTTLIPGFVIAGAGIGMVNPPLASTAVGVVSPARSGMASGINNTFRQVGIATGIAALGAVFQHQVPRKTIAALSEATAGRSVLASTAHAGLNKALVSGNIGSVTRPLSPAARGALVHAYHVGFTGSLTVLLEIASVVAVCGAALAFALVRSSDFVGAEHAAGAPEGAAVEAAAG